MIVHTLAWLYWDPSRIAFTIPIVDLPVAWYGLLFSFGFLAGFFILLPIIKQKLRQIRPLFSEETIKEQSYFLIDKLTWYIVAGTVIGARLGHVFLYEWPRYQQNPIDIFKVWEGGLASHGGVLGIILAIWLFHLSIRKTYPELTLLVLLDCLSIPGTFAGMCIRIGNFFNQEIIGPETTAPWGVIFGHPMESGNFAPRHPAQLYEAGAYLLIFLGLAFLWKKKKATLTSGTLFGLCMIFVFGARFILEFFKSPQSLMIDESFLFTGHYLSIPFILIGIMFLARNIPTKNNKNISLSN